MHHSATPSGLLSMMLSTMLSRLLCRLLSTLVMKGKERKGKEREGERLAPPGISIFVQQALQPASCIFKGASLRAAHVSVSTGFSPATASSPKRRQDRRRPSLGLGRASRWRAVGAGGLEARVGGSASGWACAPREGCKTLAGPWAVERRVGDLGGKARPSVAAS